MRGGGSIGRVAAVVAVAGSLVVAACGDSRPPPDVAAVQGYLTAIAEGNYRAACSELAPATRAQVRRALGRHAGCPALFVRCLPDDAFKLSHDNSQLLFASVAVERHGGRATASVSGTAVARAVRQVTLAREHRRWWLTSYGTGLRTCDLHRRRAAPSRRSRGR